jgi:hypothetical protein
MKKYLIRTLVLIGKFRAMSNYIKKLESFQINNLINDAPQALKKQEQAKPQSSEPERNNEVWGRINKMETKKNKFEGRNTN